jgi:hypothetical protein
MKQKKYLANRRWKYYRGTKKEGLYLFRQSQQEGDRIEGLPKLVALQFPELFLLYE